MLPDGAAMVIHDLKNALGSLEAELASLKAEPARQQAADAHQHCVDLRQRFVQFLTLYGADGPLRALCEDESPQDLLTQLKRDHDKHPRVQNHQVELTLLSSPDAPAFWYVDRRLVRMALEAALNNALRFARHHITLSARQEGEHLVYAIDDDGPGLTGDTDDCPHRTGLGTAICIAVAESHHVSGHNGRIELFDRPAGGARFELWLP